MTLLCVTPWSARAPRFQKASEMCGREFLDEVDYWAKCWVPARQIVQRAIEARAEVHPSKSIIRLDVSGSGRASLYTLRCALWASQALCVFGQHWAAGCWHDMAGMRLC